MRNRFLIFVFACLLVLPALAAGASYQVLNGTFASGGGVRANGSNIVYDTSGQPVIGIVAGASNRAKIGFWYCASISSTVDVTITSFFGELKDDVVLLTWTAGGSSSIEGFNVYRSDGTDAPFVRLNGELIAREKSNSYPDETALAGHTYLYRVGAVSKTGESFSQDVSLAIPPKPTTLYQNYPNPFNPSTTIAFYLPSARPVTLVIYDVRGAQVKTLVNATRPVGRNVAHWNGKNDGGAEVASGVYYYRLKAGADVITKKLVILR